MEIRIKAKNAEELNAWFDHVCTRCAMCNRDCGQSDPCSCCIANKTYEWMKFLFETHGKEDN